MKKMIVLALAVVMLGSSFAYAAKAKPNPAKTECLEQAKKEGIAKKKVNAYVKDCMKKKAQ